MKNIALIKSIVATSISSANPAELTEHIAALIQAHPEETRENALAILTGTAELTVRPVDQVELTCNSSNYTNLSFMGEPTVNLLEGTVCCSINYTRTETRWYKTEEDANAGRNGSYNHDDYVIAREKAYKDWQGRVETLTTSIYLGEIRDRFFFLFTKISEYYLDSNSASRKLIKLSNHGTDCFSQPAHRSRIYVGCSQLWHCSTSLHLSGAAQAAERR